MSLQKVLFVPDTHAPYEDTKAWNCMIKVAKVWKPDIIVVLGDLIDNYVVSDHDKSPTRRLTILDEAEAANHLLDQLDSLDSDNKLFLEGNHEYRLERYLWKRAPELHGITSITQLLKLKERGWKFTPYKDSTKIGTLHLCHDADSAGKYAMWETQATYQSNVAFGHTHALGVVYTGNAMGVPHVSLNCGWLGDKKYIDYRKRVKSHRSYITGFGIGYLEGGGNVFVQPVPIVNNRCLVEGKIYE